MNMGRNQFGMGNQMGRMGNQGMGMQNMGMTGAGSTTTVPRQPVFKLDCTFVDPAAPRTEVPVRIRDLVANANSLPSRANMKLEMVGGVLVLTGKVNSEAERALAETLVRLEPGIYSVKNDLTFPQPTQPATPATPASGGNPATATPPAVTPTPATGGTTTTKAPVGPVP